MILETKFNLEDKVYTVIKKISQEKQICIVCEGIGYLDLKDKTQFVCPKCNGVGKIWKANKGVYIVKGPFTIWKISKSISIIAYEPEKEHKTIENYMLMETGIESGRVYNTKEIFSNFKEAQGQCNLRNKILFRKENNNERSRM
jgi:hypothetical protein